MEGLHVSQAGRGKAFSPKLTIRLLGRFEVLRDEAPIPQDAWGRRKTETLLKILLIEPGRIFSQDQLVEILFEGEDPQRAVRNLHGRVSQLRRALEPDLKRGVDSTFVVRKGQGYFFNVDSPCWIDTAEFRRRLDRGEEHQRSGDHLKGVEAYEEAIRLYRGEFLEADRYEEWALEPRETWQDRYIAALTRLAEGYAHLGDCHRAALACREAFDLQPWRESVLQQLMRYHHTAGERSEALRVYERGVEALKQELDVEPSAETEVLHQRVLDQALSQAEVVRDKTRIAVLPLANMSPDPADEYFADGMTEELIYTLSQISELKVIAQTSVLSYKNTKKTVAQIGRELSIGTVLEGSVRKADDTVRITIQFIDVGSEEHVWAEKYDRPLRDIFSIQSDIAQRVSGALRVHLLRENVERIESESTGDLEAFTLYIRGRRILLNTLDAEDFRRAIKYFEQALAIDPGYAAAWAGLAGAHIEYWFWCDALDESVETARAAADRAVALDPQLAEGYVSQALVKWAADKELVVAESLLLRALELAPRDAIIHYWYSKLLTQLDRRGESLVEMLKMREIDPLSHGSSLDLASYYRSIGELGAAIEEIKDVLRDDPKHLGARIQLAYIRMQQLDWDGAEAELLEARRLAPDSPDPHWHLAEFYINVGRTAEGLESFEKALAMSPEPRSSLVLEECAMLHLLQRDYDLALEYAKQAEAASPRIRFSYWIMAICHCQLGNYDAALEVLKGSERTIEGLYCNPAAIMSMWVELARGMIHARRGGEAEARAALARLQALPENLRERSGVIAALLFELGEIDQAFERLEKEVNEYSFDFRRARGWPLPQPVREDPRFAALLKRMGLPPLTG
jgi:TolB-like protein/two-component SAPR family response regulator/Tfp pilus assembly protein PilF